MESPLGKLPTDFDKFWAYGRLCPTLTGGFDEALDFKPASELPETDLVKTYVSDGKQIDYYAWNDSAGESLALYVNNTDRTAMLCFFEHESILNFYGLSDYVRWDDNGSSFQETDASDPKKITPYELQLKMYDGVPEYFKKLRENQEPNYEWLNIKDPNSENTIYYAGGIVLYSDGKWSESEGYTEILKHSNRANAASGYFDDGGFFGCADLAGLFLNPKSPDFNESFEFLSDEVLEFAVDGPQKESTRASLNKFREIIES